MPHAEVTRLVRLSTGVLEEYAIDSMPPYIAVSHAWADGLSNSGTAFSETIGGQALLGSINNSVNSLQELHHCWVDTFCIDQASEVDKHRQIPLMGSIFSDAVSLAVMLPYDLQFTQADVDRLGEALEPAFKMVEDHDWSSKQARRCREEPIKSLLIRALYGLSHLVKGSWATRVWTAQEFLLAKAVMWIGTDHSMIRVPDSHFSAIIALVDEHFSLGQSARLRKLKSCMLSLLLLRLNRIDRTRFITQISDRECSVPQDVIYGAMAASGVSITVTQGQRPEDIWRLWWEVAITQQHVRWACCTIMWKTPGVPPLFRNYNCVMPPFEVRRIASDVLHFDRVEPLGPVQLKDGTVSLYGYDVGVCKIVAHLGHHHKCIKRDGLLFVYPDLTTILWSQGNFKRAFRIATALGAGTFNVRNLLLVAQVLTCNYSKALWAVTHNRQDSFSPVFRSYEQHRIYAYFTRLQGYQGHSVAEMSLEVYLATISNTIATFDVAILLPGKAPQGQLRALDFNVTYGRGEFDPKVLTILESPTISTAPITECTPEFDTLHKVGVTLPVQFFNLGMYGQHNFEGGEP